MQVNAIKTYLETTMLIQASETKEVWARSPVANQIDLLRISSHIFVTTLLVFADKELSFALSDCYQWMQILPHTLILLSVGSKIESFVLAFQIDGLHGSGPPEGQRSVILISSNVCTTVLVKYRCDWLMVISTQLERHWMYSAHSFKTQYSNEHRKSLLPYHGTVSK